MSDDWLRLIPTNPEYVPDAVARRTARDLLASLVPEADEVTVEVSDAIQFYNAGANWGITLCPGCGDEVPTEWWQHAMDLAYVTGFCNLEAKLPCCNSTFSLNELRYDWPQGFARFALTARNPNVRGIEGDSLQRLETILGCPLRMIWTHY